MMTVATGTAILGGCAEGINGFAGGEMFVEGPPEAGPAGAAVVLPVGFEQGQVAAGTDIGAGAVFVVQFTAAGKLGL